MVGAPGGSGRDERDERDERAEICLKNTLTQLNSRLYGGNDCHYSYRGAIPMTS